MPRLLNVAGRFTGFWLLFALSSCMFLRQGDIEVGDVPQNTEDRFVPRPDGYVAQTWVSGLNTPWSLVFLHDDLALVSERKGNIRLIRNGDLAGEPYASLPVSARGEGGLMGLAVHPGFPDSPYVYAMYTYRSGSAVYNKVVRLTHDGSKGVNPVTILDRIPGARFHNGGRIAFGPDSMLYITTGENFDPQQAQNYESLAGKILRIRPDGSIPDDNPFDGSPLWTSGHRNPQGVDWDPESGLMYASGHGPSGEFRLQGKDLINIIKKGNNYGWPEKIGAVDNPKYADPLIMWSNATPPGGISFWKGNLYVATLRSEALIRIELDRSPEDGPVVTSIQRWFAEDEFSGSYGRLRDVTKGPDGALYFTTSNRDGRGDPGEEDDRIIQLTPE